MLKPSRTWNGKPNFEFIYKGLSDANYVTDPSSCKSISGYSVFLEDAPISMKSRQQKSVTLSTVEAELVSGTQCAQDMLFRNESTGVYQTQGEETDDSAD
jgi:hypothetical protein